MLSTAPTANDLACVWRSQIKDPVEMRTWRICKDLGGFCYRWRECTKRFLRIGWCQVWTPMEDRITWSDTCMLQRLQDMNMRLHRRH